MAASARHAFFWSAIDVVAKQGTAFAVSVVLARMLAPEIFGIVTVLLVFVSIANVVVDAGFSTALIQDPNPGQDDATTVFWINMGASSIIVLAFWAAAPGIAAFFRVPELEPLTYVMATSIVIGALGAVHNALLAKHLEFKRMSRVGFISTAVAGFAAIVAAHYGAGVWALAVQSLTASALTTATLWLISDWRPGFRFSVHAARRLFRFGGFVFMSSVLEVIYARAYAILIGKWHGVYDLGIYGRANDLSQMPSVFMGGIVSRVLFSLFSMTASETDTIRRRMKRAVTGIMFVHVPIMLGLIAVAPQFVPAVFGPQWLPSVPFLQVLCVAGIFWPLHVINLQALLGKGYSELFFRIEVAKKIVGVTCLITGAFFGLMGIALGQLVAGFIALGINAHYSESRLGYGLFEQLRDSAPVLLVGLAMAMSVFGLSIMLSPYFDEDSVVQLMLLVITGAFLYIVASWVFRLRALDEVISFANLRGQSVRGL